MQPMQESSVLQQELPEDRLEKPQEELLSSKTRIAWTKEDLIDDVIFATIFETSEKALTC